MENGFALILSELKKLKSAYESQFNSLSNKEDLTQIELTILGFLLNNPTFNTAKDIEEVHVLKKSNISNAIEHLILRGYLTRNRDTQDRFKKIFLLFCFRTLVRKNAICILIFKKELSIILKK
ncbi:MAG: MarR family transcriptional regulator [Staphylococcus sp.]|nr:MarR family transcriptional regulator [Staphylococcus sp.]